MLKTPGGRAWWHFNSAAFLPEFVQYVQGEMDAEP
jgi:hypothetical protein